MNFIGRIASFIVCIFFAQTSLGFTESHIVHSENIIEKYFEKMTTYWL